MAGKWPGQSMLSFISGPLCTVLPASHTRASRLLFGSTVGDGVVIFCVSQLAVDMWVPANACYHSPLHAGLLQLSADLLLLVHHYPACTHAPHLAQLRQFFPGPLSLVGSLPGLYWRILHGGKWSQNMGSDLTQGSTGAQV